MNEARYTEACEKLARELGVKYSIAMDIYYLRELERRILAATKVHPEVLDFAVFNEELEVQLDQLGYTSEEYVGAIIMDEKMKQDELRGAEVGIGKMKNSKEELVSMLKSIGRFEYQDGLDMFFVDNPREPMVWREFIPDSFMRELLQTVERHVQNGVTVKEAIQSVKDVAVTLPFLKADATEDVLAQTFSMAESSLTIHLMNLALKFCEKQ